MTAVSAVMPAHRGTAPQVPEFACTPAGQRGLRTQHRMSIDRLTALYKTYGPAIYWRCVRLLGDGAAAEDATQETFMRVHRHLEKAPDGDAAIAWIWRIATNYCLNEIRNAKHRPTPVEELPEPSWSGGDLRRDLHSDRDLARQLISRADESTRA